ncbi:MAG: AAA family ATPase [Candidatus ainarchaeum sp.]|nr:AAA family ATPase [Candidatus ainarchaeum sp.]
MTRLIKLSLKNFKSFKKAEIPLSKGFSAIVGSNGSGKSNTLDALLFVLGITSLKTLRAGKLTDLVNTNAKENYAKVDLLIRDKDKQYEVSRMIDKQGKSVYRLDGKRTTLNEVSSLLVELGIDVDGHNIVTQGDITKIIEMSSIQRREIIDSIAGLSEFDSKKEEAIKELDKVDSKIKEATIILNERNEFLTDLQEEMRAAKEYKELEEEKKKTKATIFEKELYSLEKKTLDLDNELSKMNSEKNILDDRIIQYRKELQESKSKSEELSRKMIKASEHTYTTIGREYEEKKSKFLLEQEKIDLNKKQINKNKEKIDLNNDTARKIVKEKNEIEEKINKIYNEKKLIEEDLKEIVKKKNDLESIVREKNVDLQKKEKEIEEIENKIEKLKKESFNVELITKNFEKQKIFNEKKFSELLKEESELLEEKNKIEDKKKILNAHLNKNPEKELNELEEKISQLYEEKSFLKGKKTQEEKALNELKKVSSQCPTCDSILNEAKKNLLISLKENLVKEFTIKENEKSNLISDLKKKVEETKEIIRLISKISSEIMHEKSIITRIDDLNNRKIDLEKELDETFIKKEFEKRDEYIKKIEIITKELIESKKQLHSIRNQNIFEEYSLANKKNESLLHNKSVLDNNLSELKSRLDNISAREDDAAFENNALQSEIDDFNNEIKNKEKLIDELKEEVLLKEKELIEAKKKNAILSDEKEYSDKKIDKIEKEIWNDSGKVKKIEIRINEFNIEKGKISVRQSDLIEEKKEFEGIAPYTSKSLEECKEKLSFIEKKLSEIGAVNLKAVDNFNELKKEVDDIQQKADKLSEERLAVLDMIDKIEIKRTGVFMDCFNEVNKNFKEIFFNFFNGEGDLSFQNPQKPLESGLIIDAKHKGGKLLNIDSMSGGEKTLTALAFMFAIQLYHPAPFYAFDEADAALDKENSLKMSNLIEKIAEKSQFIAITHNDVITKKAHQIIGVARAKDDSSVIGLKLKNQQDDELKELEKFESKKED